MESSLCFTKKIRFGKTMRFFRINVVLVKKWNGAS